MRCGRPDFERARGDDEAARTGTGGPGVAGGTVGSEAAEGKEDIIGDRQDLTTEGADDSGEDSVLSRGREWEDRVGRQDCMQSRQDYIIAVEGRRDTRREEDSPGDAATRAAASRGVRWRGVLTRRVSTSYKVISTSYEVSRFGSAGGVVTVTGSSRPTRGHDLAGRQRVNNELISFFDDCAAAYAINNFYLRDELKSTAFD